MGGQHGGSRFIGGQPHEAYRSASALAKRIEEYFEACDAEGRSYTVAGLALYLGLRTRMLTDYPDAAAHPRHALAIDYAMQRVEAYTADKLFDGKGGAKGFEMLMSSAACARADGGQGRLERLSDDELRDMLLRLVPRILAAAGKEETLC